VTRRVSSRSALDARKRARIHARRSRVGGARVATWRDVLKGGHRMKKKSEKSKSKAKVLLARETVLVLATGGMSDTIAGTGNPTSSVG
jgi:hypothetical protein